MPAPTSQKTCPHCQSLARQNYVLADDVVRLRALVPEYTGRLVPAQLLIPPKPRLLLDILVRRERVSKLQAIDYIWGGGDVPLSAAGSVAVYITRLRNVLKKHDIEIKNIPAFGWYIPAAGRQKIKTLAAAEMQAERITARVLSA